MFAPKHKTFTLSGQVMLFNDTPCTLTMTGTTHGERAVITSAVFSGGNCQILIAKSLPWKVEMSDAGQPVIEKVRFVVPPYWAYAAREQAATVDGNGNWTFIASGHLLMSGTVASTPRIIIKP